MLFRPARGCYWRRRAPTASQPSSSSSSAAHPDAVDPAVAVPTAEALHALSPRLTDGEEVLPKAAVHVLANPLTQRVGSPHAFVGKDDGLQVPAGEAELVAVGAFLQQARQGNVSVHDVVEVFEDGAV